MKSRGHWIVGCLILALEIFTVMTDVAFYYALRWWCVMFITSLGVLVGICVLLYQTMPKVWKSLHESPFPILDLYGLACIENMRGKLITLYTTLVSVGVSLYLVPVVYLLLN